MVTLALRNPLHERTRHAISVSEIAFAVTLTVSVRDLFVAHQSRAAEYFNGVDADLWVLQSGNADFLAAQPTPPATLDKMQS